MMISQCRQLAGEDLEAQVFLITQAVSAPLDDADLVVESLDEAGGDLVLWMAVGGDAVPVPLDHFSELFVRFESLPFERVAPIVKASSCPALPLIAPQLTEGLLEELSGVESLVGREQGLQGGA